MILEDMQEFWGLVERASDAVFRKIQQSLIKRIEYYRWWKKQSLRFITITWAHATKECFVIMICASNCLDVRDQINTLFQGFAFLQTDHCIQWMQSVSQLLCFRKIFFLSAAFYPQTMQIDRGFAYIRCKSYQWSILDKPSWIQLQKILQKIYVLQYFQYVSFS